MKKVTLQFTSLQLLADCMFQLGITRPVIDYDHCLITAEMTDAQINYAKDCQAEIVAISIAE